MRVISAMTFLFRLDVCVCEAVGGMKDLVTVCVCVCVPVCVHNV